MCDFRNPPQVVRKVISGDIIHPPYLGTVGSGGIYGKKREEVTEPGIYHIAATGSYYSYFDGEAWHRSGGAYEFLFDEDLLLEIGREAEHTEDHLHAREFLDYVRDLLKGYGEHKERRFLFDYVPFLNPAVSGQRPSPC